MFDFKLPHTHEIATKFALTQREKDILALLSRGYTANTIANELGIAYNTAKGYIKNVYSKCEIHSRQDVIDFVDMYIAGVRQDSWT